MRFLKLRSIARWSKARSRLWIGLTSSYTAIRSVCQKIILTMTNKTTELSPINLCRPSLAFSVKSSLISMRRGRLGNWVLYLIIQAISRWNATKLLRRKTLKSSNLQKKFMLFLLMLSRFYILIAEDCPNSLKTSSSASVSCSSIRIILWICHRVWFLFITTINNSKMCKYELLLNCKLKINGYKKGCNMKAEYLKKVKRKYDF